MCRRGPSEVKNEEAIILWSDNTIGKGIPITPISPMWCQDGPGGVLRSITAIAFDESS